MPTGEVIPVTRYGKRWFLKKNPSAEMTELELRIYDALRHDSVLQRRGVSIPETEQEDDTRFLIRDAGTTFSHVLNSPAYERLASEEIMYRTIAVRTAVNDVVNRILTDDDKKRLAETQRVSLVQSARKLDPTATETDVAQHYWAYRMMNALGIADLNFRAMYTELIGSQIDALLPKYGRWCTDNFSRNNVVGANGSVVPFDFNSVRYGLRQFDDAPIAGLYLFCGPLGVSATPEKRTTVIERLQTLEGLSPDSDYLRAFLLSTIHANGIIAGYRRREIGERAETMKGMYVAIQQRGSSRDSLIALGEEYYAFWSAYDEIDNYKSPVSYAIWYCRNTLTSSQEGLDKLNSLGSAISGATFGDRICVHMGIPDEVHNFGKQYAMQKAAQIQ